MLDSDERFIQWLNAEMEARNLSQGELARRSGLSQSMISLLLLGKNKPGIDTLHCLSAAFNMRKEDVFRNAGLLDPLPDKGDPALSELHYLIPRLSSNGRARVLDYARYVDGRKPQVTIREGAAGYSADAACDLFHRLSPEAQKPVLELLLLLADD